MKIWIFFALFLGTLQVLAQAQVKELSPMTVDPQTKVVHGPHLIYSNTSAQLNGFLLISLGGTSSLPHDFAEIDQLAAQHGFQVLAIDYPNDVISTVCRDSKKPDCFDNFRRAVVLGDAVSDLVTVTVKDSIEYRIESAVNFLAKTDGSWNKFLQNGKMNWSKVVVIGHSQGSGHAAFLGKKHPLHGVIMFAGPQDTFTDGTLAPWLSVKGAMDPSRYFAFLHKNDFFGSTPQISADRALLGVPTTPVVDVTSGNCTIGARIMMTSMAVSDAHNSVIHQPEFQKIWECLITQQQGS